MKINAGLWDKLTNIKTLWKNSANSPESQKIAPFFDHQYYQKQSGEQFAKDRDAISHFLNAGWRTELSPCQSFSTRHYLSAYPDIRAAGINPLLHFLESGWKENRQAFSESGHLNELIGYRNNRLITLGPRPLALYLEWTSCNRLAGWAANIQSDNTEVQLFHQSELIGSARLQHTPSTVEDVTYTERSHFEFFVEKPMEQITAMLQDGTAVVEATAKTSASALREEYAAVSDFLHRPIQPYTPSIAPCSKNLVRAFIAKKRELLKQAEETDSSSEFLISVVMPVFNREALVASAIESVARQRNTNWELIIVDDGSSDNSLEAVHQSIRELDIETRTKVIALDDNRGVSHARNQGLAEASGQIISYLDSDNSWDRDYLSLVANAFETNPEADSIYTGQYVYFFNKVLNRRYLAGIRLQPFNRQLLEQENYIDLNSFAHHKKLYEQMGGFDEKMRRLVDWDLILRYTQNQKPRLIPALLAQYNLGIAENQITLNEQFPSQVS